MRKYTLYIWVLVILIFFIIISFLTVYFSLEGHKRDLINGAINERIHLAEIINETINSPFWVYRLALVPGMETAFIKAMAQFQEVKYIRVVNLDGRIIESSIEGERGNIIKEPDILKILGSKKPLVKEGEFKKQNIKLVIYPGYSQKTIWVGFTLDKVGKIIKAMWVRDAVIFGLSSILIFLVLFLFLRTKIISPLKELTHLCQRVQKGDLTAQAKIKSKMEIGQLAESFNRMVKDLARYQSALEEEKNVLEIRVKARTRELEELAESLEGKVKERTKQLQERVDELERFHQLTVGRELKMIELKKEIKRLNEELEKYKRKQV